MTIKITHISHIDTNEMIRYILGGCKHMNEKDAHFTQQRKTQNTMDKIYINGKLF